MLRSNRPMVVKNPRQGIIIIIIFDVDGSTVDGYGKQQEATETLFYILLYVFFRLDEIICYCFFLLFLHIITITSFATIFGKECKVSTRKMAWTW